MSKEFIKDYGAIILVVLVFFLSHNFFATPAQVEKRINETKAEISLVYATKQEQQTVQNQLSNISAKIDKIYEYLLPNKRF